MFKMIDVDGSGQITLEEMKKGLDRVGANLKESEIENLMQAVSPQPYQSYILIYNEWLHSILFYFKRLK